FLHTPLAIDDGAQDDAALQSTLTGCRWIVWQDARDDHRWMLDLICGDRRVAVPTDGATNLATSFAANYPANHAANAALWIPWWHRSRLCRCRSRLGFLARHYQALRLRNRPGLLEYRFGNHRCRRDSRHATQRRRWWRRRLNEHHALRFRGWAGR